jgi:acetyltransferase-like isoleucine patch superfamily enzyme
VTPLNAIHPSASIGKHSVVWDFARVLADVVIGHHCSIGGGTEIGRGTKIGDYSRIGANCFLPSNTTIGRYVFVGPGVVCTDDRFPRVPVTGDPPYEALPPILEDGCVLGAGCLLLPGVRIGAGAKIAAFSLVANDVAPGAKVRGFGTAAKRFEPSAEAGRRGWG